MDEVRERTLEVLDEIELEDTDDPLLDDGFVYELILAHEHQHNETMLQLLQMVEGYEPAEADSRPASEPVADGPEMVRVDGGEHRDRRRATTGFAYDNERPRHTVELASFEIDRAPVTNGDFAEFMDETGAEPPLYWERDGDGGGCDRDGRPRDARPGAARRPRRLTRPTPSPRGRASACRPSSNGRPPRAAPTATRQPRPPRLRLRAGRRLRRRGLRTAAPCRCSAMSGSGPRPTSRAIPASRRSRTPSTRRSSSAPATRCFAAARGPRTAT